MVDGAGRLNGIVAQMADEVAHRDQAQSEDEWLLGLVDEFVDPAGLESVGDVEVVPTRYDGCGPSLQIVAAALETGELPGVGGEFPSRAVRLAAPGEARGVPTPLADRVGPGTRPAGERQGRGGFVDDELGRRQAPYGFLAPRRDGQVQQ